MADLQLGGWKRHLFYRKECLKTTWILRLTLIAAFVLALAPLFVFWIRGVGDELVCRQDVTTADAMLVENFDPDYLAFERAAELRKAGAATRVFVPSNAATNPEQPNVVAAGIAELMARIAGLPEFEIIPVRIAEPISLKAAYQIRSVLQREHVRSVIIVAPAFRSRRSLLVYTIVFGDASIKTSCVPVFGPHTPANWTRTWHGIEEVTEQYVKLQYYRFVVLPRIKQRGH